MLWGGVRQVTKLVPFGAFVRVPGGIEGLIHREHLAAGPEEVVADDSR